MHQRGSGLLARGAHAKVRARHQHIACAHLRRKFGAHGFQAMRRNAFNPEFHISPWGQRIGVDVGPHLPDFVRAHASTSRGSLMLPRRAEAATV